MGPGGGDPGDVGLAAGREVGGRGPPKIPVMEEPELDGRLLVVAHRPLRLRAAVLLGPGPRPAPGAEVDHPADVGGGEQAARRGVAERLGQHPALGAAGPDGEPDEGDERRGHDDGIDADEAIGSKDRRAVPGAVGDHGQEVPAHGRQPSHGTAA